MCPFLCLSTLKYFPSTLWSRVDAHIYVHSALTHAYQKYSQDHFMYIVQLEDKVGTHPRSALLIQKHQNSPKTSSAFFR